MASEYVPLDPLKESYRLLNYLKSTIMRHPSHFHSFTPAKRSLPSLLQSCGVCDHRIWRSKSQCLHCGFVIHRQCANRKNVPKCSHLADYSFKASLSCKKDKLKHRTRDILVRYLPYVVLGACVAGPTGILAGLGIATGANAARSDADIAKTAWASKTCLKYTMEELIVADEPDTANTEFTREELCSFLYEKLAGTQLPISKINVELGALFRERFQKRIHAESHTSGGKNSSVPCDEVAEDAKTYVGHMIAMVFHTYPWMCVSESTMLAATVVIEEIVYEDIYSMVFQSFHKQHVNTEEEFSKRIHQLQQCDHQSIEELGRKDAFKKAKECLFAVCSTAQSPLRKLALLGESFVLVCHLLEEVHNEPPSADKLMPAICELVVSAGPQAFSTHLAFISALTSGGGRGAEGYTLTTFQAAVQVILNADPATFGIEENSSETEEFFDAISYSDGYIPGKENKASSSYFSQLNPVEIRAELTQVCGSENPYPHPLKEEVALLKAEQAELGFHDKS